MKSSSSSGAIPALPSSPATLTSIRILSPGRARSRWRSSSRSAELGGDRVDQPHVRDDQAHAPALQLPDEVPLEQLSVQRRPCARGPARGSRRRAGCRPAASTGSSSAGTYLMAASTSTGGAAAGAGARERLRAASISARMRSRFARTRSGSRPAISSATPAPPGARRGPLRAGGRRSARRRSCTPPRRARRSTPAASRRSRAIAAQVDAAWPRAGERRAKRIVHLVARPRSSRPPRRGRRARRSARPGRRARAARARPARARRPRARASRRAPSRRRRLVPSATGRQSAASTIAPTPVSAVAWPSASLAAASSAGAVGRRREPDPRDVCAVNLVAAHEPATPEQLAQLLACRPRRPRRPRRRTLDRLPWLRLVNSTRPPAGQLRRTASRLALIRRASSAAASSASRPGGDLAVEPAVERRLQPLARPRAPAGTPAASRSSPVDLERHVAQLGEPPRGGSLGAGVRPRASAPVIATSSGRAASPPAASSERSCDGRASAPQPARIGASAKQPSAASRTRARVAPSTVELVDPRLCDVERRRCRLTRVEGGGERAGCSANRRAAGAASGLGERAVEAQSEPQRREHAEGIEARERTERVGLGQRESAARRRCGRPRRSGSAPPGERLLRPARRCCGSISKPRRAA